MAITPNTEGMEMDSIKWHRDAQGIYVSACGTYEIARTLGSGSTAISEPWWMSYHQGSDGLWRRVAGRTGSRTLRQAKAACERHAREAVTA